MNNCHCHPQYVCTTCTLAKHEEMLKDLQQQIRQLRGEFNRYSYSTDNYLNDLKKIVDDLDDVVTTLNIKD